LQKWVNFGNILKTLPQADDTPAASVDTPAASPSDGGWQPGVPNYWQPYSGPLLQPNVGAPGGVISIDILNGMPWLPQQWEWVPATGWRCTTVPCSGFPPATRPPNTGPVGHPAPTIGPQTGIPDDHVAYPSSARPSSGLGRATSSSVGRDEHLNVVQRLIQRRIGDDALKRFQNHAKEVRANASTAGQATLFDRAESQFGRDPTRPAAFAGLESSVAPMGGRGGLISRQAAEQTTRTYKSIPAARPTWCP
jgi:hypothetical protein